MNREEYLNGAVRVALLGDHARVELMLSHSETHKLPNLRLWCKVWLDPTNDGAKAMAERHLREWVERGDLEVDASLE